MKDDNLVLTIVNCYFCFASTVLVAARRLLLHPTTTLSLL